MQEGYYDVVFPDDDDLISQVYLRFYDGFITWGWDSEDDPGMLEDGTRITLADGQVITYHAPQGFSGGL
jgi:hypothetical protein